MHTHVLGKRKREKRSSLSFHAQFDFLLDLKTKWPSLDLLSVVLSIFLRGSSPNISRLPRNYDTRVRPEAFWLITSTSSICQRVLFLMGWLGIYTLLAWDGPQCVAPNIADDEEVSVYRWQLVGTSVVNLCNIQIHLNLSRRHT